MHNTVTLGAVFLLLGQRSSLTNGPWRALDTSHGLCCASRSSRQPCHQLPTRLTPLAPAPGCSWCFHDPAFPCPPTTLRMALLHTPPTLCPSCRLRFPPRDVLQHTRGGESVSVPVPFQGPFPACGYSNVRRAIFYLSKQGSMFAGKHFGAACQRAYPPVPYRNVKHQHAASHKDCNVFPFIHKNVLLINHPPAVARTQAALPYAGARRAGRAAKCLV